MEVAQPESSNSAFWRRRRIVISGSQNIPGHKGHMAKIHTAGQNNIPQISETIGLGDDSIKFQIFNFQKSVQLAQSGGMTHFTKRLGLDLPDAFTRDIELLADFLERACVAIAEAKT
jgi:hypothetical protein